MIKKDTSPTIILAVRTLITGGFILERAKREPGYALLFAYRYDEFGIKHLYCFAIAENIFEEVHIAGALISSTYHSAKLILIGNTHSGIDDVVVISWGKFINLFGGAVYSMSPLESEFNEHLNILGLNKLPDGLDGKPDDLFETYVKVALEFIIGGRVVQYGQERRFEKRPDGIIIPNTQLCALYDAKAYSNGYSVTLDTIRQFKSYVVDFTRMYQSYVSRLNAFIVISGYFPHKTQTLERRSRELLAECGVPLVFLSTQELAKIIHSLINFPSARRSVNWSSVFSNPIVESSIVDKELMAIRKDSIIKD